MSPWFVWHASRGNSEREFEQRSAARPDIKKADGDVARVLAELQKGLESAEHAEFVERLQATS